VAHMDLELVAGDTEHRNHQGGDPEQPGPGSHPGPDLIEVSSGEDAGHHVEDVAGQPRPGVGQPGREGRGELEAEMNRRGERQLPDHGGGQKPAVMAATQHPGPHPGKDDIELEGEQEEVQVEAGRAAQQIPAVAGQHRTGRVEPAVGEHVERAPQNVGSEHQRETPSPEPAGADRQAHAVGQHERTEEEKHLPGDVQQAQGGPGELAAGQHERGAMHAEHAEHRGQANDIDIVEVARHPPGARGVRGGGGVHGPRAHGRRAHGVSATAATARRSSAWRILPVGPEGRC